MNSDIVFISFDEDNADENWNQLIKNYPSSYRIHGIKGIHMAHREAARVAKSPFFFTVDADNIIHDRPFENIPEGITERNVCVWRSINPINGLVYGYGGIKLWPRSLFQKSQSLGSFVDHATEIAPHYKVIHKIASTTSFNTSPYSSWKSGYRESFKLMRSVQEKNDKQALERLKIWLTVGMHAKFGEWCLLGAYEGASVAKQRDKNFLNNFGALKSIFSKRELFSPIEEIAKLKNNPDILSLGVDLLSPDHSEEVANQVTHKYHHDTFNLV